MMTKAVHKNLHEGKAMQPTLFIVAAALASWAGDAVEAEKAAPAAGAAFEKHLKAGTLFDVPALQEFHRRGWMRDYALLMRERWKGQSAEGVSLEIKALPNHVYRVGERFDCLATLTNIGDEPRMLDTGGSCGMTDALNLMIIALSNGDLRTTYGKAGGPHCFCRATSEAAIPYVPLKLMTGFAGESAGGSTLIAPGKHVVIGVYALGARAKRQAFVYSPPLVVDVMSRD